MSAGVDERAPGVLVQEVADRLSFARGAALHSGESTSLKVAMYLEEHPRVSVAVAEVSEGTGLTHTQVSSALQKFIEQRDDVVRRGRGVYAYFPGRKAAPAEDLPVAGPAAPPGPAKDRALLPGVQWDEPPAFAPAPLHEVHPLVRDMVAVLPPPGSVLSATRRNAWLAAMSGILAVVYSAEDA